MDNCEESEELKAYFTAINALNKSVSDTEKFGALFVVAKLLKDKRLSNEQNLKLFKSIEPKFLCRLLLTNNEDIPEGCDEHVFQSIGLSIITSFFMTIIDLIDSKTSLQLLKAMIDILIQFKDKQKLNEKEEEILSDIIICFESFFSSNKINIIRKESFDTLFKSHFTDILLEMYLKDEVIERKKSIFNLLSIIANTVEWSAFDSKSFDLFINQMSEELKRNQDKYKFELCERLNTCLKANSEYCSLECNKQWISCVNDALFDIFRSKLNKELRNPALALAATLTEIFKGFDWISGKDWTEKSSKFFILLLRLSCVEITVDFQSEQIDMSCIASCFVILENSINTIANDSEDNNLIKYLTQLQIYDMLTAIKDTISIIIEYLRKISLQMEEIDIKSDIFISSLALIRVLCVWVTEETEALRPEIGAILPFIVKVYQKSIENQLPINQMITTALISLSDNENLKSILFNENIIEIIDQFSDSDQNNELNENLKQLLI